MTTLDDIARALAVACEGRPVTAAYVFGSYARGEESPASDVDVRIQCSEGYDGIRDHRAIHDSLEATLGLPVDLVDQEPRHMREAFRRSVLASERRLYVA